MSFLFNVPNHTSYGPELNALVGTAAYDSLTHYTDYIARFSALILKTTSATPQFLRYLATEGGYYGNGLHGPFGAQHLLYWLDRLLKEKLRDEHELYTARLSEAGASWGLAAPTTMLESDPLELVETLETLGANVALVDFDAAASGDNTTANAEYGCVRIDRDADNNLCDTLGGADKTFGSSNRLINGTSYRYRYWKTLDDFNERNGGRLRFPISSKECFVLVRNTAADHIVSKENQIGCTVASQTPQPDRIIVRGYPGEWPELWFGNSTDDDTTPTECPNSGLVPKNGTATVLRIGQAVDKYRNNFHLRNLHIHGKRETAGNDWVYCGEDVIRFTWGTNCSVRYCKFTDLNPLPDDTTAANLAAGPTVIDHANSVRASWSFCGLTVESDNFVCDSNYFEGVDIDDYPNASNSAIATITISDGNGTGDRLRFVTLAAHGLTSGTMSVSGHTGFTGNTKLGKFDIAAVTANTLSVGEAVGFTGTGGTGGTIRVPASEPRTGTAMLDIQAADNVQITRNQFRGLMGLCVRVEEGSNVTIEDNIMEGYDGTSLYLRESESVAVRRNRIGPHGAADYALSTASHGIQVGYCSDVLIEDNIIRSIEPTNNVGSYGVWLKANAAVAPLESITVRRNLVYRSGLYLDNDFQAAATISDIDFSQNLVVGMTEMHKTKESSGKAYMNANVQVNFLSRTGNVAGTLNGLITIRNNQFWRFANATPSQSTIEAGDFLAVRNTGAALLSDYYDTTDTLAGWTGNTTGKPDWVGDPELGDFRMTTDPIGFDVKTPFTEAMSQAWEPD